MPCQIVTGSSAVLKRNSLLSVHFLFSESVLVFRIAMGDSVILQFIQHLILNPTQP